MTHFTIAEDFPESEIAFEQRFSNEQAGWNIWRK